ncbi:MAG: EAL domain-containing protein [Methylophaga sp.]|nr:EAL domain-containing protein [Methylophaga sp.]
MSLLNVPLKYRIFIAISIYILWVVGFAYYSFSYEKDSLYASLDQQLETAALTTSLLLPDKLHHQDMVKGDLSSQADTQNMLTLSNYTDNTDIVYTYTLILRDDAILFTSSSATKKERQSGEGLSYYFDRYDDVDPRVFEIFNSKQSAFLEYTDQWGSFRSTFIPNYSEDGTFYLAVADLAIDDIQTLLNQHLYKIIALSILFLCFVYPIYIVSTQYISRKSADLELQLQQQSKALITNQQRLEHALSTANQAWYEINLKTMTINVSDEYRTVLGIGKNIDFSVELWQANMHTDDRIATMESFHRCIETGEPVFVEYRVKSRKEGWKWISAVGEIVEWDQQNKPLLMVGMNMDITERKRNEQVLQTLAESGSSADKDILHTIVRQLALSHNVRYAFIAIVNVEQTQASTVALWGNGQFIDNISYDLAGTPCETVLDKVGTGIDFYTDNIQQLFPDDPMLAKMKARSYVGASLKDANNNTLGLISIVDDNPTPKNKQTISLLNTLAVRASIELERQKSEENLILFSHMFHDSHEGILLVNNNDIIIDINPTFCANTGYSKDELLGQPAQIFRSISHKYSSEFYDDIKQSVINNGSWQGEVWNRRKDNSEALSEVTITQITDVNNNPTHRFILANDITEKKQQQDALKFMAHYDALTQLPNRTLFVDRFNQAVARSKRNESLLAICFLDLDNFKPINDNYGHEVGDQILLEVSQRISSSLREEDTVSRQGGDEFTLLLGAIHSFGECEDMLTRILKSIAEPYSINGYTHIISASIGVTLYPLDNSDIDTLTRHADHAMYQAKQAGRNQYSLFDALDDKQQSQQLQQQRELYHALEHGQFCLHYQPKVNMKTGKVFGVEALIRWQHPEQGMLFPLDFLPATEGTRLENEIGHWVIEKALSQMDKWRQQDIELEVSVNISSHHLQSASFISDLEKSLVVHPEIESNLLQLEILESSALGDIKTVSNIIKLCQDRLGVRIALDDFGTGYSSLTHLRNLSAQTIKIDRSFVRDLLDDPNDFAIVNGIIGLSEAFNREIIAEGVETTEHGLMLITMGCDEAQGYGISKPMPAAALPVWLENYTPNKQWTEFGEKTFSPSELQTKILKLTTDKWFNNIKSIVESSDKPEAAPTLTLCHLGTWVDQLRKTELFDKSWLTELHHSHDKLFSLGEATLDYYSTGHKDKAIEKLEQLRIAFDALMNILDEYK